MIQALPPDPPAAEIVVTARALPDPAAERAYSVENIDDDSLRRAPSYQLDQILKQIPGLQLFRRSDARSGHPTSQGITLRALGGNASSRALLMLDGVPQSDPFGGWVNWPAYDPAAISEVRVIRGGGSVANGPGALAGTIEMISSLMPGASGGLEAGSRESLEARLRLAAPLAGGQFNLSGRGSRGDGFVPITEATRGAIDRAAPYQSGSIRGLWVGRVHSEFDLQLGGSAFLDERHRGVPFTGNRTDGANLSLRLVGRGAWPWSALTYGQWRNLESSFASVSSDRASASRVSLQDSVPSHAIGFGIEIRPPIDTWLELRVGADGSRADGETRELFNYVAGEATRRRVAGGKTLTAGLFGEMTATLGSWVLSGGLRLDRWRIADGVLREWLIASGAPLRDEAYASRSGWLPTARAGVVFGPANGVTLRSAVYLGWRAPTLNELFRPFRAGPDATAANPSLKPEKLIGAELGAQFRKGPLTLSLTAFDNRLTDAIANVTLGQGPGVFPGVGFVADGGEYRQRQNLRAVGVRGLEGSIDARRGPWSARIGASFTDAQVDARGAAEQLDGLRPAQTPRVSLTGSVGWERDGRVMALNLRHVGAQFEDDLNEHRIPSATTIDAFVGWPLSRAIDLVVRGENLLDETIVAGIGGDGAIERATPRTLWIGFRFR